MVTSRGARSTSTPARAYSYKRLAVLLQRAVHGGTWRMAPGELRLHLRQALGREGQGLRAAAAPRPSASPVVVVMPNRATAS